MNAALEAALQQVRAYVDSFLCVLEGGWDLYDFPRIQVELLEHIPVELCYAVAECLDALNAARDGDDTRRCSALIAKGFEAKAEFLAVLAIQLLGNDKVHGLHARMSDAALLLIADTIAKLEQYRMHARSMAHSQRASNQHAYLLLPTRSSPTAPCAEPCTCVHHRP